jgi:hypothetical protein
MKSIWKTTTILVVLVLIMPGCLDIWISTKVNTDGSIEKTIQFNGSDSAEIAGARFAFLQEEGWKKEWSVPEKDKFRLTATRQFKSVKQLNASMNPADTNLQVVRIDARLQRKFRWFFTRFVYTETVLQANPFNGLNYHDYLNDKDIRLISLNDEARKSDPEYDSVAYKVTEKKFEDFLYRSMFEDFYRVLVGVLKSDPTLTLKPADLEHQKELIFRTVLDSTNGDSSDAILKGVNLVMNHPDIQVISEKHLKKFDGFHERMKFYEASSDDSYKFTIRMPGLLLQTNSRKIEGADTGWELTYYDFFFHDFQMTAESRKVNSWAFVVAGLLLIVALASLTGTLLRKKK